MAASQSLGTTTASTCAPETAHGTHLFKIDGYSMYRGLGVGVCVNSATFAVGGHDWCLCVYPDGENEEVEDWVSVYVELKTKNTEVRALYDLRIVDRTTRPPQPVYRPPNPSGIEPNVFDTLDGETSVCGHTDFLRKSEIHKYLMDDILLIECSLTVIKFKEANMNSQVQVPPSDLLNNLGTFLESTEGADVFFKVKEQVIPAHKFILATRSPVFRAEFYGPMRDEHRCSTITIEGMQPAVFRGLLHFTYMDSLPPMDDLDDDEYEEMVRHLLVAADRYAMERMKLMCESKLCESLHAETVAITLALADQHNCSQLKDACIEFINSSNRMNDVVASNGFDHLKRACPTIFIDIWEKAAKTRKI
jgi:speckle-type POZ protein